MSEHSDDSLLSEPDEADDDTLELRLRAMDERPAAAAISPPSPDLMVQALERAIDGRLRLVDKLGQGGMGAVYKAEDLVHGGFVALKTMVGQKPQGLYRFKKEFRALQGLQHPNLVGLGELIEAEGVWCFTMELVEGTDLMAFVQADAGVEEPSSIGLDETMAGGFEAPRRFDEARLRSALGQLTEALMTMHNSELVHRDIKPSNVLVTDGGRVVVLDFGLITDTDEEHRSTGSHIVGTVAYMAPEQAASRAVGPQADWYSVGVMLYEALTGRLPHTGAPLEVLLAKQTDTPPRPSQLSPGIPKDLDTLCMDLLAFAPGERPRGKSVLQRLGARAPSPKTPILPSSSSRGGDSLFVGRQREMAIMARAYENTQSTGALETVFVVAGSGMGKSELIKHFVRAKKARGAVCLSGRCLESESVPFKALDGIIDDLSRFLRQRPAEEVAALLPRRAAQLATLFPVLGRVEAIAQAPKGRASGSGTIQERTQVFGALRELFQRLCDHHTLIVTIDDLQWADDDSLTLLRELLAAPEAPSMLLLITARPHDKLDAQRMAIVQDRAQVIDLEALDEADAHTLAQRLLAFGGREGELISPERIAREAGRHPLFIAELVRYTIAVAQQGRAIADIKLDDAIRARRALLDAESGAVLDVFCLGGAPLPLSVARQATKLDPQVFARSVSKLRIERLLRRGSATQQDFAEPYHDRVRESIRDGMPQEQRLAWHQRLAVSLATSGLAETRPELLLMHCEAAGESDRAAHWAEKAAAKALKAHAFARAAELYETALRLSPPGSAVFEQTFALGKALQHAGHNRRAGEVFLEAHGLTADDDMKIACMGHASQNLFQAGELRRGAAVFDDVCRAIGVTPLGSGWSAVLRVVAVLVWAKVRGNTWTSRPESQFSPQELRRWQILNNAARASNNTSMLHTTYFHAISTLQALRMGEDRRASQSVIQSGLNLAWVDARDCASAHDVLHDVERRLRDAREDRTVLLAHLFVSRGMLFYIEGRLSEARRHFEKAREALAANDEHEGWDDFEIVTLWTMHCMMHSGDYLGLRSYLVAHRREALQRGARHRMAVCDRVYGFVWAMEDNPAEAYRHIEATRIESPFGVNPLDVWEIKATAELACYEGRAAEAWAKLAPESKRYRRSLLWWVVQIVRAEHVFLVGRLALDMGRDDPSHLARVHKSIRRLKREKGHGYSVRYTMLLQAGLAIVERDPEAPRLLRELLAAATEHEQMGIATAARLRLGELLGGDEGTEPLSKATAEWRRQGIARPSKFARIFLPDIHAPRRLEAS